MPFNRRTLFHFAFAWHTHTDTHSVMYYNIYSFECLPLSSSPPPPHLSLCVRLFSFICKSMKISLVETTARASRPNTHTHTFMYIQSDGDPYTHSVKMDETNFPTLSVSVSQIYICFKLEVFVLI